MARESSCLFANDRYSGLFGGGALFTTADVRVAVWQKEPFGRRMVCSCFGETEATIADEIRQQGQSTVVRRVREHIKQSQTLGLTLREVRQLVGTTNRRGRAACQGVRGAAAIDALRATRFWLPRAV